jgi:hypothetical protein
MRGTQHSVRDQTPVRDKTRNHWLPRLRFYPLPLAGALAAAALAIVYFGPKQVAPLGNAAVQLTAIRGAGATTSEVPAYHSLDLSLDLTGVPPSDTYRVELADERGNIIWTTTQTAAGDRLTVSYAEGCKPGSYWLRVAAPDGRLLREYGFQAREQPAR